MDGSCFKKRRKQLGEKNDGYLCRRKQTITKVKENVDQCNGGHTFERVSEGRC